jgi:malate dehydrogenase (oxaloacetate-decarboxylating)(NADP+)
VLIFPDLQSASIACKLLTHVGGAEPLGPILMGMSKPVYVLPRGADTDDIVNIATIAVVDAQEGNPPVRTAESERTEVAAC